MKKILIYDVAADSGGAQTILERYYHSLTSNPENDCYFVVSVLHYPETDNTHVIKLPWVKKSWFHRLYCDYVVMPRMIRKLGIDEVLSLQNMGIPGCRAHQTVYVHNAIPFTEHKFSFSRERFLWVYQNVIGRMMYHSLKKSDKVIVQTQWMKDAVIEKCGLEDSVVCVERIDSAIRGEGHYSPSNPVSFFYPSGAMHFKNHKIVIDACRILNSKGIRNYRVFFTIEQDENELALSLARAVKEENLPVYFIGKQTREQMVVHYRQSVLLFPSYLETVGLPLLEVQPFGAPMIVADCAYARETVGTYENVQFFHPNDSLKLAELMGGLIS